MMRVPISHWRRSWLYACVAVILLYLVLPIFIVIPASFSDSKYLEFPPRAYSLKWYDAYIHSADWMNSTRASLVAAFLTMLLSTPVGVAAAYCINTLRPKLAQLANLAILLPIIVPNILIGIGIFYVYIQLEIVNSMLGIVIAHSLIAVPFVVITALSGLKSFDLRQEQVARSLGAPRLDAFMRVTLPQILPSVISGALFAFIISLDEVVLSLFVAGGDNIVLTRRMFVALRDAIDPTIAAISTIFIATSLGVLGTLALIGAGARAGRR